MLLVPRDLSLRSSTFSNFQACVCCQAVNSFSSMLGPQCLPGQSTSSSLLSPPGQLCTNANWSHPVLGLPISLFFSSGNQTSSHLHTTLLIMEIYLLGRIQVSCQDLVTKSKNTSQHYLLWKCSIIWVWWNKIWQNHRTVFHKPLKILMQKCIRD